MASCCTPFEAYGFYFCWHWSSFVQYLTVNNCYSNTLEINTVCLTLVAGCRHNFYQLTSPSQSRAHTMMVFSALTYYFSCNRWFTKDGWRRTKNDMILEVRSVHGCVLYYNSCSFLISTFSLAYFLYVYGVIGLSYKITMHLCHLAWQLQKLAVYNLN